MRILWWVLGAGLVLVVTAVAAVAVASGAFRTPPGDAELRRYLATHGRALDALRAHLVTRPSLRCAVERCAEVDPRAAELLTPIPLEGVVAWDADRKRLELPLFRVGFAAAGSTTKGLLWSGADEGHNSAVVPSIDGGLEALSAAGCPEHDACVVPVDDGWFLFARIDR